MFPEVANSSEFLKTLESCTEPGQPAKTSVSTMLLSQTTCEGMGNMQFLFYYILYIYAIFKKNNLYFHLSLTIKKISPAIAEHKTSFCSSKILDPQQVP